MLRAKQRGLEGDFFITAECNKFFLFRFSGQRICRIKIRDAVAGGYSA